MSSNLDELVPDTTKAAPILVASVDLYLLIDSCMPSETIPDHLRKATMELRDQSFNEICRIYDEEGPKVARMWNGLLDMLERLASDWPASQSLGL
jgi:hypothetical protein